MAFAMPGTARARHADRATAKAPILAFLVNLKEHPFQAGFDTTGELAPHATVRARTPIVGAPITGEVTIPSGAPLRLEEDLDPALARSRLQAGQATCFPDHSPCRHRLQKCGCVRVNEGSLDNGFTHIHRCNCIWLLSNQRARFGS